MDFVPVIADADVADLRERLVRTRWAGPETSPEQGVPLAEMQRLVAYWRDGYSFERLRQRVTSVPQVVVRLDGLDHHAIHVRSSRPDATPLLLAHGWPSTCFEFLDLVPLLTEPEDGPAFHVVCPSLPGYAFGGKPRETGWGAARTAAAWVALMQGLGHEDFLLHGGDWGAIVGTELAVRHPEALSGLHLSMPVARTTDEDREQASAFERQGLEREGAYRRDGFGYAIIQMTRPQSIGYGLDDSPVALCAWIVEKLLAWTDRDADGASLMSDDAMLDVVSLYWLTQSGASSARFYSESLRHEQRSPVTVPTGCTIFPGEVLRPPRSAVERRYTDLRSWHEEPRGGHFPAAEVPAALAARIQAFATLLAG